MIGRMPKVESPAQRPQRIVIDFRPRQQAPRLADSASRAAQGPSAATSRIKDMAGSARLSGIWTARTPPEGSAPSNF